MMMAMSKGLSASDKRPGFRSIRLGFLISTFMAGVACSTIALGQVETVSPVPADRYFVSPGGVDIRTGRFDYKNIDLTIGDPDNHRGISLVRTGDNGKTHLERFAQFSHNWDIFLSETPSTLHVAGDYPYPGEDGLQVSVSAAGRSMTFRFPKNASGPLGVPIHYSPARLAKSSTGSNGHYTYTAADGTVINFLSMGSASNGRCKASGKCSYASDMTMPDGTRYELGYDNLTTGQARLRSVVSSTGFALLLEYNGSSSKPYITKACVLNLAEMTLPANGLCPAGVPTTGYQYAGDFMSSATDVTGAVWTFANSWTSNSADYAMSLFKPGGASPYLVNSYHQMVEDPDYRVVSRQQLEGGPEISYSYNDIIQEGDAGGPSYEPAGGSYSYDGKTVSVVFGAYRLPQTADKTYYVTQGPETIEDELGNRTRRNYCITYGNPPVYDGCRLSPMRNVTDPEGGVTEFTYDGNLNVIATLKKPKPGSALAPISTSAKYQCGEPACYTKPTQLTDAKGNITDIVYDLGHGGVLSETGPAVNGVRPQKRLTYVQRHAWLSNGSGGYARAATPVWLLASESYCRSSSATGNVAAPCALAGDEVLTVYDYGPDSGPNNLLLRGQAVTADGQTRRSCILRDGLGRKVSETTPNANLGSCQ